MKNFTPRSPLIYKRVSSSNITSLKPKFERKACSANGPTRIEPVCYLSDMFTHEAARGRGVGRALVEGVYSAARAARSQRVYWQTQATNAAGRHLYDQLAKHQGFIVYAHELLAHQTLSKQ